MHFRRHRSKFRLVAGEESDLVPPTLETWIILISAYETLASYASSLKGSQLGPEGLTIIIQFIIPCEDVQHLKKKDLGFCLSRCFGCCRWFGCFFFLVTPVILELKNC